MHIIFLYNSLITDLLSCVVVRKFCILSTGFFESTLCVGSTHGGGIPVSNEKQDVTMVI